MKDVFHVYHTLITFHTPYSVIPIYRLFLLSLLSLGTSLLVYLHFFSPLIQTPTDSNQDTTQIPVLGDPRPQQSNQTHLHCAQWHQKKKKIYLALERSETLTLVGTLPQLLSSSAPCCAPINPDSPCCLEWKTVRENDHLLRPWLSTKSCWQSLSSAFQQLIWYFHKSKTLQHHTQCSCNLACSATHCVTSFVFSCKLLLWLLMMNSQFN